jgi:ankyrin repeat protein
MRHWMRASLASICSVLLACALCFTQNNSENHPLAVSFDEVRDHLMGEPPLIRVSLPQRESVLLGMQGIPVRVTVDVDGNVISAIADKSVSADLQSRSEAAAKNLHFRPFERGGHAVVASFEHRVIVLPPELLPKTHIPFPTIRDWNSLRMTLKRTTCFGTCPSYRVEIHGDGTVLYEGQAYVAITGSHRGSVSKGTVSELVDAFRNMDYYSLEDEYVWPATDLPTYETSIEIDGKLKKVKDYAGAQVGMPLSVSKLEAEIDRLVDTERWTKGNENTVKSLRDEKWDFKSPQTAEILARVAKAGQPEVVTELLAAGVPIDPDSKTATMALVQAGARGDASMLQALLGAGARKNTKSLGGALFAAASAGRLEAVRLLIATGATPTPETPSSRTLLMAAAGSGVPGVVQEVLSFNPDVNTRGAQGRTALMEAVGQPYFGAERVEVNRAEVVRLLLERGADPNIQDERGNTALIECAWHADAALALIKHGANLNTQNKDGLTALINSVSPDVAHVLVENGADLYLRDKEGKTALEEAKRFNRPDKEAVLDAAQAHRQ